MGTGPIIHAQSLRLPLALKPLFFTYLPPNEGLGPTGCPPSYLHTLSKTDSVKLLMVTSTSSTGKKNKVQMEDAPVSNVHSLICTFTVVSAVKGGQYLLQSSEDSLRQILAQYYGHDQHSALLPNYMS